MDYSTITKKRFNTKEAQKIIFDTLLSTQTTMVEHSKLQAECKHAIYMRFGWTKGSVHYVNEKLTFFMVETGLLKK